MSGLAEFLQGKVEESLKVLVQPAGLVPATLFMLLNLAFVYPALKDGDIGFAKAFSDLDTAWQAIVVGALILLLGYVLVSLSSNVIDLLAGESWNDTWLYRTVQQSTRNRVKAMYKRLVPPADQGATAEQGYLERLGDWWELRVAYPVRDLSVQPKPDQPALTDRQVADVAPTAIGNTLRASHLLIRDRYGIDPVALWPQMQAVTPKDDAAKTAVDDAKASLDTLANLVFVLAVFGTEGLVLHSGRGDWSAALLSALALPTAYVVYRATVTKARAWGDAMEVVFDVYRGELHQKLKLRKEETPASQRKLWLEASRLFLWGRTKDSDAVYEQKAPETPKAKVVPSRNLALVEHREYAVTVPAAHTARGAVAGASVDYALMVARTASPDNGLLAFTDSRIPRIGADPAATVLPQDAAVPVAHVEGQQRHTHDALVWQLSNLEYGRSFWLSFTLAVWEVSVSRGLTVAAKPPDPTANYETEVEIETPAEMPATRELFVYVAATAAEPVLRHISGSDSAPSPPTGRRAGGHYWDLAALEINPPVKLSVEF
jgi:hypothetical protein